MHACLVFAKLRFCELIITIVNYTIVKVLQSLKFHKFYALLLLPLRLETTFKNWKTFYFNCPQPI